MKALVIATIGTPRDSSSEAVASYLANYLGDSHVISLPQPFRRRLVEGKIIPRHLANATKRYQMLEAMCGGVMPIRKYMHQLVATMRANYSDFETYALLLHSDEAQIATTLEEMVSKGPYEAIHILPLYPQQTFSSYNSVLHQAHALLKRDFPSTPIFRVRPYYTDPNYINLLCGNTEKFLARYSYDLVIASFHSIPLLHQWAGSLLGFNYREQCTATARAMAQRLSLTIPYEVMYQSAMGEYWLKPSLEAELCQLPKRGFKRVLLLEPSFLVDCIETLLDVASILREQFLLAGGECLDVVPTPNSSLETASLLHSLASSEELLVPL